MIILYYYAQHAALLGRSQSTYIPLESLELFRVPHLFLTLRLVEVVTPVVTVQRHMAYGIWI